MEPWQKKLPMWITWFRMWLVPVIVAMMMPNQLFWNVFAAILFMVAGVSDYYDGYFARKYNVISNLGKVMDPIADKILVSSILVMLIPMGRIEPLMVVVILARDTFIGGIRSAAAADGIVIEAKATGKWKTFIQMVALPAVMIGEPLLGIPFQIIGYWVLWGTVILSMTSGVEYYWGYLKSRKTL